MTEFEYFSAMIGVILALGVTHILAQAGLAVQGKGLVRLYWVHGFWVGLVLLSHFAAWWNIWRLRDSLEFSYPGFLYTLIGPTALYLAARVLVPRLDAPVVDLESHYYSAHKAFFALIALFLVWPVLMDLIFGNTPSLPGVLQHLVLLVPVVACAMSSSRRLHALVAIFVVVVFAGTAIAGNIAEERPGASMSAGRFDYSLLLPRPCKAWIF